MVTESGGGLVITSHQEMYIFWFVVALLFFGAAWVFRKYGKSETRGNIGAGIIFLLVLGYELSYEARLTPETGKVYAFLLRNDQVRWSEATRATLEFQFRGATLYITDIKGNRFEMPMDGTGRDMEKVIAYIQSRIPVPIVRRVEK